LGVFYLHIAHFTSWLCQKGFNRIPSDSWYRGYSSQLPEGHRRRKAITAAAGIAFDAEENLAAEHGIVVEGFS